MTGEIDGIGARTPHELMRCAEVTFIRDCAEMAARASLVRTESRWGLYHERTDHPARDDDAWLYHLNLRKRADGEMEFIKRPVAEYLFPVDDFRPPAGPVTTPVAEPRSFSAVAPPGVAGALVGALADADHTVRAAAAAGLRELADVLPVSDDLAQRLRARYASTDHTVREIVVELLRVIGLGTVEDFRAAAEDADVSVRLQAIRGLVRRDDVGGLGAAALDPAREVRVAAAHGLGTVGDPRAAGALHRLAGDDDALVRAAALAAAALIGCPDPLPELAVAALADGSWQVREGAAKALAAAEPGSAVPALLTAARDANLDVRRAAIRSLAGWPDHPEVITALHDAATTDPDADVRAWARRALALPV